MKFDANKCFSTDKDALTSKKLKLTIDNELNCAATIKMINPLVRIHEEFVH